MNPWLIAVVVMSVLMGYCFIRSTSSRLLFGTIYFCFIQVMNFHQQFDLRQMIVPIVISLITGAIVRSFTSSASAARMPSRRRVPR